MRLRRLVTAPLERFLPFLPDQMQRDVQLFRGDRWRKRHYPFYPEQRRDWHEFFRRAFMMLRFNGIDGDYAEFGCAMANTFTIAYHESRRVGIRTKLWAFDSFEGLPAPQGEEDSHPAWIEGTMRTGLERFRDIVHNYGVPPAEYEAVPGFYDTTLLEPAATLPRNIALAYIDCDLYSSSKTVLGFLLPRLKHGMILAFDDYYCFSSTQPSGERRACAEVFRDHPQWQLVPYVQYGWHGMSFIVESRRFDASTAATF